MVDFECSRFCSCQSTQKPQRSTGFRPYTTNSSIKSTYLHPNTTKFNKRLDPFWEQRVVSSNLTAPTIENAEQIELFAPSEKLAGVAFEGGAFCMTRHAVDSWYLPRRLASASPAAHIHCILHAGCCSTSPMPPAWPRSAPVVRQNYIRVQNGCDE